MLSSPCKTTFNPILFIFPFRFREIFYCTGRFDQRCFSCGTISNRVHCYDVGSPCDLDIWDPSSWKVGAKMNLGAYYSSIPMEWTSGSEAVGPYRDRVIIDALLRNQIYFSTLSIVVIVLSIPSCNTCRYQTGSTYLIILQIAWFEGHLTMSDLPQRGTKKAKLKRQDANHNLKVAPFHSRFM